MPREARCRTVNWDWDEFLEDTRVSAMTNEELGAWVRVLGAMARAEVPGVMRTAAVTRIGGGEYRAVMECLEEVEPGLLTHRRTVRDHAEQTARVQATREAKSAAGKASAAQRLLNTTSTAVQPPSFLPSVHPDSREAKPNQNRVSPKKARPVVEVLSTPNQPAPPGVLPETWAAWFLHRKAIRKPLNELSAKACAKQLADFYESGHDPDQIISNAIASGWQGLFVPPEERNGNAPKNGRR